jgi:putative redox protein
MAVEMEVLFRGGLRCEAVHGPSNVSLCTDAPRDNQGEGTSFSPTDLVGAALGTCMVTIMAIAARQHALDIEGTTVKVSKEMVAQPLRRIGRLVTEIHIPARQAARLDLHARQLLVAAAETCPVKASLHPAVECVLTFVFEENGAV